jgi:hypothetical protein
MNSPHAEAIAGEIGVHGGATDEEIAAVVAALGRRTRVAQPSAYERWRAQRLAALRPARSRR